MEEKSEQTLSQNSTLYYGIGATVLVLLIAGIYLLRPKTSTSTTTPLPTQAGATGAPLVKPTGPITGLACEIQYYNPVIGLKQYYLSAEGSDVSAATKVDCSFTAIVAGKEVAKAEVKGVSLTDEPSRNGKSFRCSTKAMTLEPNVPTSVDVVIADDQKATATCSSPFLFPAP